MRRERRNAKNPEHSFGVSALFLAWTLRSKRHSRFTLINASLIINRVHLTMVTYVNSDGTVSNRRSIWRVIEDTISGFIGAIMLFFSAVFNPPSLQVSLVMCCLDDDLRL